MSQVAGKLFDEVLLMLSMTIQAANIGKLHQRTDAMARMNPELLSQESELMSLEACRALIQNMHVHQIELEMQNEDLRREQLALLVLAESYRDLYDSAPVGYCTADEQGVIRQANHFAAALLGVARNTLLKQSIDKFILDADREIYCLHQKQLGVTGRSRCCELRLVKPDGTTVWVQLTSAATQDAEGTATHRVVLNDISERKQRDDQLSLQALVLDQIRDQVTITDLKGIVSYVNKINVIKHGGPDNAMLGRHVSAYGDGPDADATRQEIVDETLTKGFWRGKVVNSLPDVSSAIYDLRTTLINDDAGRPICMVGVGTDIAGNSKLSGALPGSELFCLDILNSLDVEIAVLDQDGVILLINESWRNFAFGSGIKSPELPPSMDIGANYLDACESGFNSPSSETWGVRQKIQAVLDRISPSFTMEYPCHSPLRQHWFRMSTMPLSRSLGGGVVITHTNITEQKKVELALTASTIEMESANQAKSRFLAAASHDLRQPLLALSLYVDVLESRVSQDNKRLVGSIQDCVVSLSGLLTDLRDVSKLAAGVVIPNISSFALNDVLTALASVHTAEADLKGLRLHFRESSAVVRTDPILLQRLIGNLIANAIEFTKSGGVLIACRRCQGKLWVEVWDTGIGIPEEQLGVIFDEFKQLGDGARTRGSGLGLSIVEKTAKLLKLQLRVSSRTDRGSMFAIELPRSRAPKAPGNRALRQVLRRLRIGVVDDNLKLRTALILALQESGHDVVGATNGRELIACLGQVAPDVVISDYRLSAGETGFDVIKATRDVFGQNLPAFLITGDTDPSLIRSMADRGIMVHYKPFQIDALKGFINKATDWRAS